MKLYNFTRLITKYAVPFIVETDTVGSYDSGIYKPGAAETHDYTGAIVPMSERKQYQSGGTYTSQDRELYMFERIPEALRRGRVVYGNNVYNIESETAYTEYADVYVYTLRRVSADDKAHTNTQSNS